MREQIRLAFEGDTDIYKFFDPTSTVNDLDEVVENIYEKILESCDVFDNCTFHGFESGYVFYCKDPSLLISFGINVDNRKSPRLWEEITSQLGGDFQCLLWSRNDRAIKWLQKMGMEIEEYHEHEGHSITKLKYSICH
jgi:hypothetical protein